MGMNAVVRILRIRVHQFFRTFVSKKPIRADARVAGVAIRNAQTPAHLSIALHHPQIRRSHRRAQPLPDSPSNGELRQIHDETRREAQRPGVGCPVRRSARTAGAWRLTGMSTLLTLFLLAPLRDQGRQHHVLQVFPSFFHRVIVSVIWNENQVSVTDDDS